MDRRSIPTRQAAAARGKHVLIVGASIAGQCLSEGLADELLIHLVPIVLADGIRLFADSSAPTLTKSAASRSIIGDYSSNLEGTVHMRLRLLGTESGKEVCPALYATDRGTYVVQGKRITDPEAIAGLVDVREDEFYVEIPPGLLRYAQG
jgi:hypothetical protein